MRWEEASRGRLSDWIASVWLVVINYWSISPSPAPVEYLYSDLSPYTSSWWQPLSRRPPLLSIMTAVLSSLKRAMKFCQREARRSNNFSCYFHIFMLKMYLLIVKIKGNDNLWPGCSLKYQITVKWDSNADILGSTQVVFSIVSIMKGRFLTHRPWFNLEDYRPIVAWTISGPPQETILPVGKTGDFKQVLL